MKKILRLKIISVFFLLFIIFGFAAEVRASTTTPASLTNDNCSWELDPITCTNKKFVIGNDIMCKGEKLSPENVCCCLIEAPLAPVKPVATLNNPFDNLNIDIPGLYQSISCKKNADGTYTCPKVDCIKGDDNSTTCEVPWIAQYIIAIYNYALIIIGALAAVTIMAGGVIWLISGSNASRMKVAKEMIIGSVSGLVVMFSSYMIISIINPDILIFKPLTIGYIKKIEIIDKEETTGCTDSGSTKRIYAPKLSGNVVAAIKKVSAEKKINPCYYYAVVTQESAGKVGAFADDRRVRKCGVTARRAFICSRYPSCCGNECSGVCGQYITSKDVMPTSINGNNASSIDSSIVTGQKYTYGFGLGQITYNSSLKLCTKNNKKGFVYYGTCYSFYELLTSAESNLRAVSAGTTGYYCPQAGNNGAPNQKCFEKYNGSGPLAVCTGQKKMTVYQKCLSEGFEKISNTTWSQ